MCGQARLALNMEQTAEDKKLCKKIFSMSGKDTEVFIVSSNSALTRFADNIISQNVAKRSREIVIKLIDKGKVARVTSTCSGNKAIGYAVKTALAMLKMQRPDPELLPLAKPVPVKENDSLYHEATAEFSPDQRAEKVRALAEACRPAGQTASGTIESGWQSLTVANSNGVFASSRGTDVEFDITVKDGNGLGWAGEIRHDVSTLDFEKVGRVAREKARLAGST